jgi:hypothetical protein
MKLFGRVLSTVVLLALTGPGPASGQEAEVGIVSRIKERHTEVPATQRAHIWRLGGSQPAHREALLHMSDIVRMRNQVFIDVGLFGQDVESRVVFGTRELAEQGAYEIRENSIDALGGIELVVRQGVMVVEHARGRLSAIAAGVRTQIFGTTALFFVEDDGRTGRIYLPEGAIGFVDWPELERLEAGEFGRAWRISEGQQPTEIPLDAAVRRRWHNELEYNRTGVWTASVPFWRQPRYIIPATAAIIIGSALVYRYSTSSPTGQVVITIPR